MAPLDGRKSGEGWIGFHFSQNFQSPQFIPELRADGMNLLQTTLVEKNGQWEVVETMEPYTCE